MSYIESNMGILIFLLCIILLPFALAAALRLWFIFVPILAILAILVGVWIVWMAATGTFGG